MISQYLQETPLYNDTEQQWRDIEQYVYACVSLCIFILMSTHTSNDCLSIYLIMHSFIHVFIFIY